MVVPNPEFAKSRYQSLTGDLFLSFQLSVPKAGREIAAFGTESCGGGSGVEDGDDALAAGGADGDESTLSGAGLVQHLGQRGDDPAAGRSERVSGRQRRAVDVELRPVDRAERGVEAQLLLA